MTIISGLSLEAEVRKCCNETVVSKANYDCQIWDVVKVFVEVDYVLEIPPVDHFGPTDCLFVFILEVFYHLAFVVGEANQHFVLEIDIEVALNNRWRRDSLQSSIFFA
jgi:hypothetical protein